MDFGVVSHNNKQSSPNAADPGPNQPGNEPGHGSGNLIHQRSEHSEDWWKNPKMGRPNEVGFTFNKKGCDNFAAFERSISGFDDGQKMLSFSSSEPRSNNGGLNGMRSIAFSISQDDVYNRIGGGFKEVMRSPFAIIKGPFTPSQWMELEVQALIYKHFVAHVPVPSNLLLPLKRSLYSYGSSGSYASNFLGWGPFHLGFSGSNYPEPGRCRRTDGKKWRCSRDAVPDQKYCERHINRGRHRSRKPVEGQTGHALSGSTTTTPTTTKVELIAVPPSTTSSVMSSRSPSISLGALHQFHTGNAFSDNLVSRTQGFQGNPVTPSTTDLKSKDIPFAIPKLHNESSHSMFGLVTSDSLVNPSERISYINATNTNTFLGFNDKESTDQNPVRQFTDDWPKDQPNRDSGPWPKKLQSDWTQLSMSIPDFSSSSSSPPQEKSTISPLKFSSNEFVPIHMSLGANGNNYVGEPMLKQSWVPVSWGSSMGGPLGEVLNAPNAWNNNSPQIGSSPTGVLQKSMFASLSNNSSSGSSPTRDDNKKVPEANTLCGGLGSSLAAIPSL